MNDDWFSVTVRKASFSPERLVKSARRGIRSGVSVADPARFPRWRAPNRNALERTVLCVSSSPPGPLAWAKKPPPQSAIGGIVELHALFVAVVGVASQSDGS